MSGIMMAVAGAQGNPINLGFSKTIADNDFAISPTDAYASVTYEVGNDGVVRFYRLQGSDGSYAGEWLRWGNAGDFEVRFTIVGGSFTDGTFGTWLSLSSPRSIGNTSSFTGSNGVDSDSGTATVEIRRASSGEVLGSCLVTINTQALVEI